MTDRDRTLLKQHALGSSTPDSVKSAIHSKLRAADALADAVAVLVQRGKLDERSPAADALLDYREPPRTERTDRIAELEQDNERLKQAGSDLCNGCGWCEFCENKRLRAEVEILQQARAELGEAQIRLLEANERLRAKDAERLKTLAFVDKERHHGLGRASVAEDRMEAALEHCAQASVLLKQSHGDAEALKYVGLAVEALKGEGEPASPFIGLPVMFRREGEK